MLYLCLKSTFEQESVCHLISNWFYLPDIIIINEQLIFFYYCRWFSLLLCGSWLVSFTLVYILLWKHKWEKILIWVWWKSSPYGFLWIWIHCRDVEKTFPEVKHAFEYSAPGLPNHASSYHLLPSPAVLLKESSHHLRWDIYKIEKVQQRGIKMIP